MQIKCFSCFSSGSCLIPTSVLLLKLVFHIFIQMWKFLQAHFDFWNGAWSMHLAEAAYRVLLMDITHDSSKSNGGLGIRQMAQSPFNRSCFWKPCSIDYSARNSLHSILINVFASLSFSNQLSQHLHLAIWPASAP